MERRKCAREGCGETFIPRNKNNIYCSTICQEMEYNRKKREKRKGKTEERACENCGKIFQAKKISDKYCSNVCAVDANNKKRRVSPPLEEVSLEALIEEAKEKEKARREREKSRLLIQEQGKLEYIVEQIKSSVSSIDPLPPRYLALPSFETEEEMCLLISDCHVGEEVIAEEIHDLGEYNFTIFCRSVDKIIRKVYEIASVYRRAFAINDLHIIFLGDIVNHELLFRGQHNYNEMDLYEQIFRGAYKLSEAVAQLAPEFRKVYLVGVPGNHGRIGKRGETKKHVNFDLIVYRVIELILQKHENIEFCFPKSFFLVWEIAKHLFFVNHGENVRMYYRTPFYGLEQAAKDYFALLSRKDVYFDYYVSAHFHRQGEMQLPFGELLINGSFVGPNSYSIEELKTGVSPRQMVFGVNEKDGITWRQWINLD